MPANRARAPKSRERRGGGGDCPCFLLLFLLGALAGSRQTSSPARATRPSRSPPGLAIGLSPGVERSLREPGCGAHCVKSQGPSDRSSPGPAGQAGRPRRRRRRRGREAPAFELGSGRGGRGRGDARRWFIL